MLKNILFAVAAAMATGVTHAYVPGAALTLTEAKPRVLRATIPVEITRETKTWIRNFSGRDRYLFAGFLDRGAMLKTFIQDLLVAEGAPPELYYLAMIESGLVHQAVSKASAVGLWQFMVPTARRYGLRVDEHIDERLDIVRSTRAASRYLRDLYRQFGSWPLAMAAYNAGEGRVLKAIRRGGTRNYWKLVRRGFLPRETSGYVPQFHAAMQIARNPLTYGFHLRPLYDLPPLERIEVPFGSSLEDLATKVGVDYPVLRALNPHWVSGQASPGGPTGLYVPKS